jgi:glucose-6-phosphate-specific signal transduction histidine kinase
MLYAVAEIAAFMVGATIIGFLLGRVTKRAAPRTIGGKYTAELASAQSAIRELESERASLKGQLLDAKERTRQLAAETTDSEAGKDTAVLKKQKKTLERSLEEAEAQAKRLRATIAERDNHLAALAAGETPVVPEPAVVPIGYSSSAGTLADMKIVFDDSEEE